MTISPAIILTLRVPHPETAPRLRRLPENGCKLWQDCPTCPLPACAYLDAKPHPAARLREFTAQAFAAQGFSRSGITVRLHISRRSVFRSLARGRAKEERSQSWS